jgi:uncharacterized protein with NAD-binding domain and iron-sulfur cluster
MAANRKVAVLGGGMGGLSAAYEIVSRDPTCEITIFQMGWRLGGKCASSRNAQRSNRIEEHGVHLFLGCYENAFDLIDRVYRDLGRDWEDAFEPAGYLHALRRVRGRMGPLGLRDARTSRQAGRPPARRRRRPNSRRCSSWPSASWEWVHELVTGHLDDGHEALDPIGKAVHRVLELLHEADADAVDAAIAVLETVFGVIDRLAGAAHHVAEVIGIAKDRRPRAFRKLRILAELGLASTAGLLRAFARDVPLSGARPHGPYGVARRERARRRAHADGQALRRPAHDLRSELRVRGRRSREAELRRGQAQLARCCDCSSTTAGTLSTR